MLHAGAALTTGLGRHTGHGPHDHLSYDRLSYDRLPQDHLPYATDQGAAPQLARTPS